MITKEIKHCLVLIVMFFSFVNIAHASVVINEVRVNPTGERFIELYNSGKQESLTDWVIKRKTESGTEYTLVSASRFKDKNISAGGYFILINEYDYTGNVISDATWAKSYSYADDNTIYLYNNNGSLVSKVGWGKASDCDGVCLPNPGNDNSIQRTSNGGWVISLPAPKDQTLENNNNSQETQNNINNDIDNTTNTSSSSSTSSTTKEIPIISKITTKIVAPKIVTAGVPFEVDHLTTGLSKEKIVLGKFVWNFGDGRQKQLSISDPFSYVYDYPGDYVITLSYSDSSLDTKPDATDRITVKVIPSGVIISSVGTYADPFVELENKSNYEMSVSGWILKGSVHAFMIPEGTVILANKKLKLSPKITGFDFNDLNSISIIDTTGQIFASYPNKIAKAIKYIPNEIPQQGIVKSDIVESNQAQNIGNNGDVINLNDLGASAAGAGSTGDNGFNNKTMVYLGLIGIIVIGALGIILLRHKPEIPDYVDKEITANDMKIIE